MIPKRYSFAIPSSLILAAVVCLMALTRCGFPVCIAGIGLHGQADCGSSITTTSSTTGTGQFTVTATPTSVVVGGATSQIQASGGQFAPYTYEIDPNSTNPGGATGLYAGSIVPNTGVYTPPATLNGSGVTSETVTIRATDTTGAWQSTTITVTSG